MGAGMRMGWGSVLSHAAAVSLSLPQVGPVTSSTGGRELEVAESSLLNFEVQTLMQVGPVNVLRAVHTDGRELEVAVQAVQKQAGAGTWLVMHLVNPQTGRRDFKDWWVEDGLAHEWPNTGEQCVRMPLPCRTGVFDVSLSPPQLAPNMKLHACAGLTLAACTKLCTQAYLLKCTRCLAQCRLSAEIERRHEAVTDALSAKGGSSPTPLMAATMARIKINPAAAQQQPPGLVRNRRRSVQLDVDGTGMLIMPGEPSPDGSMLARVHGEDMRAGTAPVLPSSGKPQRAGFFRAMDEENRLKTPTVMVDRLVAGLENPRVIPPLDFRKLRAVAEERPSDGGAATRGSDRASRRSSLSSDGVIQTVNALQALKSVPSKEEPATARGVMLQVSVCRGRLQGKLCVCNVYVLAGESQGGGSRCRWGTVWYCVVAIHTVRVCVCVCVSCLVLSCLAYTFSLL